jgi:PAS domain S-box-containing protein
MPTSDNSGQSDPLIYSDVLLELTPDDTIKRTSRAFREYIQVPTLDHIEGRPIQEVLDNPVLILLVKKWIEKLNKGQSVDESFPLDVHHDDQYKWFRVRAVNASRDGRVEGKVFFISEETELYSQKKILDTIMSSFPGDIIIFDRTMRILLVSDSIARANGFHSWRDLIGRSLRELVRLDMQHIDEMLNQIILRDEPTSQVAKITRGDGNIRWIYRDLRTIKSTAGTFGYILTQFDMTDEIKPKAILEALMDSSSDAIAIVGPEGNIEYASQSLVTTFGLRDWRSALGKPWSYLFANMPSTQSNVDELFSGDWTHSRRGMITIGNTDGKTYLDYRIDPLVYQNESFGLLCIASNNTELREAKDRAELAVRAKAAFLANMSHELRTPMNSVLGMSELLSRTALSPLQKNYMSHIRSSAVMLLSIINDILDFSRLEDRRITLLNAPYNFNSMIHDVVNMVGVKVVEKELSFTVDLDPDIPETLVGDEIRVKQILINLLNNAVKFTDSGEINLSVSAIRFPMGHTAILSFRVRDTGIGIPKEKQAEIFQRFSRVESERNAKVEGSGLGLSICKELVGLMNGSLRLESAEGAGSVFIAEVSQKVGDGAAPIVSFDRGKKISLLVFDTETPTIASIRQMAGYARIEARFCLDIEEFNSLISYPDFSWTHVIFEYRTGYEGACKAAIAHPETRWLSMLSIIDFVGNGKHPAIDFVFKPLVLPAFAKFLQGARLDFSKGLPLVNTLGVSPLYFRASNVRVLVVDDSAVNRKVAEGFLQTLDIKVDEAASGAEALDYASKSVYDIVLMDHMMPSMDGLETTMRMRRLPGYQAVPIIALTGNSGGSYTELFRKAGMTDWLFKPIDFNAFVTCLKKWLPDSKRADAGQIPPVGDGSAPAEGFAVESIPAYSSESEPAEGWIAGLDRAVGIEYTGSIQNLEMVLGVFRRTASKLITQLETGRSSGNQQQYRTSAHALVSSIANIGGTELSARARDLEQAIIAGDSAESDRLYEIVHAGLESLSVEVARYFDARLAVAQCKGV